MRKTMVVLVAGAALVAAAPAAADVWKVAAGYPGKPPRTAPFGDMNTFFPATLQIHVGDRVTFVSKSFHTATFPGARKRSQLPLVLPDPAGSKLSGFADASGTDFWFNGLTKLVYNAQVVQPRGSKVVADKGVHNSGILLFQRKGYTFSFPKAGVYKLICAVHPGMQATVVVKPAGASIPTHDQVQARVAADLGKDLVTAGVEATKVPSTPNTVYAGQGKQVALDTFQPKKLTVKVGTTVTWVENSPSEIHNIAFGPLKWINAFLKKTDLLPVAPGAPSQFSPVLPYGSDKPGPYVYDGTNHGNGFLATPVLDDAPGNPPQGLARSFRITFTKAGTYHYICMIHGKDMAGDVVVTE
jgi:plastocyanin